MGLTPMHRGKSAPKKSWADLDKMLKENVDNNSEPHGAYLINPEDFVMSREEILDELHRNNYNVVPVLNGVLSITF